jgi:hypothetical protein
LLSSIDSDPNINEDELKLKQIQSISPKRNKLIIPKRFQSFKHDGIQTALPMKKASLLQLMPYTIKEKAQDDSLSGGISSCSMSDDSVSKGGSPLDVKEKSKLQ